VGQANEPVRTSSILGQKGGELSPGLSGRGLYAALSIPLWLSCLVRIADLKQPAFMGK